MADTDHASCGKHLPERHGIGAWEAYIRTAENTSIQLNSEYSPQQCQLYSFDTMGDSSKPLVHTSR